MHDDAGRGEVVGDVLTGLEGQRQVVELVPERARLAEGLDERLLLLFGLDPVEPRQIEGAEAQLRGGCAADERGALVERATAARRAGREQDRCLDETFVDLDAGLFVVVDAAISAAPIAPTLDSIRGAALGAGDAEAALRRGFARADERVRALDDVGVCATAVAMLVRGRVATVAATRDVAAFVLDDHGMSPLLGHEVGDAPRVWSAGAEVLGSGRVEVEVTRMWLSPGDRILLCSDGVLGAAGELDAHAADAWRNRAEAAALLTFDAHDDQALIAVECGAAPARAPGAPTPPVLLDGVEYPLPSHPGDDLRSPGRGWVASQVRNPGALDGPGLKHRRLDVTFETWVGGVRRRQRASLRALRPEGFDALALLLAVHEAVNHHLRGAAPHAHLWPGGCLLRLEREVPGDVPTYRLVLA